jgi:hypothetical protein
MFRFCSSGVTRVGWNDFSLPAVGERFDNEDGSSRQLEIQALVPGDVVELVRQPDNPHDHMAVAIMSCSGTCVGYLGRVKAQWIGSKMDRGMQVSAIVERVRGANMPGSPLGLVLRLNTEGEEPALPDGYAIHGNVVSRPQPDELAGC